MMTCRDVAALSDDHVAGRLARRQRLGVRLHLLMCRHCRRALRQLRATLALLRAAGAEPAPTPAHEAALTELFRQHRPRDDEPPG